MASQNQRSSRASRPRVLRARPPVAPWGRNSGSDNPPCVGARPDSGTPENLQRSARAALRDLGEVRRRWHDNYSTAESVQPYHRAGTEHNPGWHPRWGLLKCNTLYIWFVYVYDRIVCCCICVSIFVHFCICVLKQCLNIFMLSI